MGIELLFTRPAITQCTGRITDREYYSQFGVPIGRIIDLGEVTITELGVQNSHYTFLSNIVSTQ